MSFLEIAEKRFSVRTFSQVQVEDEKVKMILRAAQIAPTACNRQPQKILIIKSKEGLDKWYKCTPCHFNETLVFVLCYEKGKDWCRPYDGVTSGYVDVSIITTHMMLEASDIGIGSTWVMNFDPEKLRLLFGIPVNFIPISVLAMGYQAENTKPSMDHFTNKKMSEFTVYEHF